MLELELTFLVKRLPKGLQDCPKKEILDIYVPKTVQHPNLRIRKNGDKTEITKKAPLKNDYSVQLEQTIPLTQEEFAAFEKIEGKRVRKIRYYYPHNGLTAEVDVFQDELTGLVLVDFEFENEQQKNAFKIPDFCLAEVTQEEFLAGGRVCGKKYADLENNLKRFGYQKLAFQTKNV